MGKNGPLYRHRRLCWVPVLSLCLESVSRMPTLSLSYGAPHCIVYQPWNPIPWTCFQLHDLRKISTMHLFFASWNPMAQLGARIYGRSPPCILSSHLGTAMAQPAAQVRCGLPRMRGMTPVPCPRWSVLAAATTHHAPTLAAHTDALVHHYASMVYQTQATASQAQPY